MDILFTVAIALFAGLLLSRLAKLVNLPAVTAGRLTSFASLDKIRPANNAVAKVNKISISYPL